MKKGIILAFGGLLLLAGCGNQGKNAGIPIEPKWKGAPYHIEFDTKAAKPAAAGVISIPNVKYTANPDALETRAVLVVRFNIPGPKNEQQPMHRMIGAPVDIHGAEGALPADYMQRASKGLEEYLAAYCADGKVNLSVALARSSINPQAGDGEIDEKLLSDWLTTSLVVKKKPHSKC